MKKVLVATVSLIVMLHSPLARAQDANLPEPVMVVANVLQLTESQVQGLVKMIQDRDAAIRPLVETLQAEHAALATLLDTPGADPAKVGQAVLDIHNGEKHVSEIAQGAAATFAATLTDEQRQRMQSIIQAAQIAQVLPAFKALGLI
ncbi:MAG TPA: periplasmic heavy metal sensor [Thermoanaerobaculia bacterium]